MLQLRILGMVRNEKHLQKIRKMPCIITNNIGENCNIHPVHAHHLTYAFGGGMGLKVGDDNVVPLCWTHHQLLHSVGERSFWKTHGFDTDDILHITNKLWKENEK